MLTPEQQEAQIAKHSLYFPKGMTVKELKALIADWPVTNQSGEDTKVLISTEDGIDCTVHSSWCSEVRFNANDELVYDLSLDVEKRD